MARGGKREGAGRPAGSGVKPDELKTKSYTFRLYLWEVGQVRSFIKNLRKNKNTEEV